VRKPPLRSQLRFADKGVSPTRAVGDTQGLLALRANRPFAYTCTLRACWASFFWQTIPKKPKNLTPETSPESRRAERGLCGHACLTVAKRREFKHNRPFQPARRREPAKPARSLGRSPFGFFWNDCQKKLAQQAKRRRKLLNLSAKRTEKRFSSQSQAQRIPLIHRESPTGESRSCLR